MHTLLLIGLVTSFVAAIGLYTERYFLKKRLRQMRSRLADAQKKLRHLGLISHEVAHEIKNPITAIVCSAETLLLLLSDSLASTHKETLHYMKEHGEEILRLVGDFLDLSRYESGKLIPTVAHKNPKKLVDQTLGLLRVSASRKQINLLSEVDSSIQALRVDPRHFRQILFNLVHNAIKYSPKNSEIVIQVTHNNNMAIVSVRDEGVGVSPDLQSVLFEPYTKGEKDGVGLGLALCRSLVQLNGGDIGVKSTYGKGAEFFFTVPLSTQEEIERDERFVKRDFEQKKRELSGRTFIVLDETQSYSSPIGALLEALGATVKKVTLVVDLIELLKQQPESTVIIEDPDDGLYASELTQIIEQDEQMHPRQVLIITEKETHPVARKDINSHIQFLEKPFSSEVMLSYISRD